MKVLVIDDSPEDRELYRRYLSDGGEFHVEDTETLREARQRFQTFAPDCVLVDFNLPDADGMDVIDALRSDHGPKSCAFIIVTGHGSEELAISSFRSGADDYISKDSMTPTLLQSQIRLAVDRAQLRRERQQHLQDLEHFASVTAHDLKAPLQTIKGYTELSMQGADKLSETTRNGYLCLVLEASNRMESLIDGLLIYAQSGEKAAALIPVDVTLTVKDVTKVLASKITAVGARIEYGDLGMLVGDALGIHQVFQNLIDNAVEHAAKEKPRIVISRRAFGNWAIYSVSDNGQGIPEQDRERIFAPLVRLGDRPSRQGHGLGLAICQQIVERHGGRIWVQNGGICGGAEFCFSLPLQPINRSSDD